MRRVWFVALICASAALAPAASATAEAAAPLSGWRDVVQETPYWESQGVHANLTTIRRWVLAGEAFCARSERHILFDRRMTFLGYMDDEGGREANQQRINEQRLRLAQDGRVHVWAPGDLERIGYPFVLSCNQPHARLSEALDRYAGVDADARLWGTWDGMRVGEQDAPVSLHEAIRHVYEHRRGAGRIRLADRVLAALAGKAIIESAGVRDALSPAGARGIMQLSAAALSDCGIEPGFHYHRLAQIDCALALLEQNHRNLEPAFEEVFGHLPHAKAEELYGLLLLQAYHGGIGRVRALLSDPNLNAPALYFAQHHDRFTAGDIALGMVYHNLGRNQLGFASLYYVTDVSIAIRAACSRVDELPGCP